MTAECGRVVAQVDGDVEYASERNSDKLCLRGIAGLIVESSEDASYREAFVVLNKWAGDAGSPGEQVGPECFAKVAS